MKKINKPKKIILACSLFLLAAILYIALGTTLPYVKHKAPSDEAVEKAENAVFTGDGTYTEKIKNITDNKEALLYRLKMIDEAKSEIVLATFEFFNDESGNKLLASLWSAAERGVKVKLLVDGYKASQLKDSPFLKLLASNENAEIKFYNELNPLFPWKAQSRMHEKYLICDKNTYLVGGRNTNDRFLGDTDVKDKCRDRELLVISDHTNENSSAKALYSYFEGFFSHPDCTAFTKGSDRSAETASELAASSKLEYEEHFKGKSIGDGAYSAKKITLITGDTSTGNRTPDVWYQLIEFMKTGKEVLIQTPYIMCGDEMYSDLEAVAKGRDVKLFINSPLTGSNVFGGADYLCEKDRVHSLGIAVFEHTSDIPFHTKTIVVDGNLCAIGSFNLDMRSVYLDSELMLIVDCEELNTEIRSELDDIAESSRCISPDGSVTDGEAYFEPEWGFSKKVKQFLIKAVTRPIRFLL